MVVLIIIYLIVLPRNILQQLDWLDEALASASSEAGCVPSHAACNGFDGPAADIWLRKLRLLVVDSVLSVVGCDAVEGAESSSMARLQSRLRELALRHRLAGLPRPCHCLSLSRHFDAAPPV